MKNIQITVIIPNYNNKKLLEELLSSLKKSTIKHKIIIVDNASKDDSVLFIKKQDPEIKLIENKINKGFAYAVNQGIKESSTEYIILLNNDTIVLENTLEELLKTIKKENKIFSASAKMIQYHDKNLIDDAGDEYTLLGWSKKKGYNKSITSHTKDKEIFSSCAGAAIYKRGLFEEIGYFDENFVSYIEDIDLSFRARIKGYKCYYSSKSIVYHYGSATTSQYNPFKVKISARNNIFLIHKNMPRFMKVVNSIFLIIGFLIKYLFFIKKGYGQDYKAGIKEGLKNRHILTKSKGNIKIYLKIEWLIIKNTITYLR